MNHMRVTVVVETWTGPSATHASAGRSVETSDEAQMPEGYASAALDAILGNFTDGVTRLGGTVREIWSDPANNPPP